MEVILLAVCFGIFVYAVLSLLLSPGDKSIMGVRFRKYLKETSVEDVRTQVLKEKQAGAKKKKSERAQRLGRMLTGWLGMAGVRLSVNEFILLWMLSLLAPLLLGYLLTGKLLSALAFGAVGAAAPPFFVYRSRAKRQEKFNVQLGEALTIMSNCIKAGFSFQQALESIASEMQPPISTEFSRTLREMR
jgi:tight adherence protein B